MAGYTKFNQTIEDIYHGKHDFSSHALYVVLCDVIPAATDTIFASLSAKTIPTTYISGYPGSLALNVTTSEGSDGGYELIVDDLTITASGGTIATFQYIVVYNNFQTDPAKPLVCWFDYGSGLSLAAGEALTVDFGADGGTDGQLFTAA
jgi:hypothetical protein